MNQEIINQINTIPIFDIMNVRGYCVVIEGKIRTFVFAQDIAREAGMVQTKTYYNLPQNSTTSKSGGNEYYKQDEIRWDRFNHYVNLSLPAIQQENPDILPLIQLPIHAYSYIPCEVALIVLMHCRSEKALRFQVRLATIIMPKIQQQALKYYEEEIDRMQTDIYDLQEMIDCNNVNKMNDLEEEIERLRTFIKDRKYRLDSYDLDCLKGLV